MTALILLLILGLATSTREGRDVARQALRPYERKLWIATAALWAILIAGFMIPP